MTNPLVSICLPNRNTLLFLAERVDTIFQQTYTNWELVVSDNYSDDGAWEFFEAIARTDRRVSIARAPREGMYANWNRCLERARGDYIYVATSDDGMATDCLEKLVAALESHPHCDAAHCMLTVVDQRGRTLDDAWWKDGLFHQSDPGLANNPHVRTAPYDGLLCLSGQQVYYSITELLLRRSALARIGTFDSRWGSVGDFHWYMKLGLVANTIHVPDTWASWRIHASQATAIATLHTVEHAATVEEMIDDAIDSCAQHLAPAVRDALFARWIGVTRELRSYYRELKRRPQPLDRRLFQGAELVRNRSARLELIRRLLGGKKWPDAAPAAIRRWLESLGGGPMVRAVHVSH